MSQHVIEILDHNLNPIGRLQNTPELRRQRFQIPHYLRYGETLSGVGSCVFRVGTKDPIFDSVNLGNVVQPLLYHARILRDGVRVWQGIIVNNPWRTNEFVEVEARTYEWLLGKILLPLPSNAGASAVSDITTINSGTLAAEVLDLAFIKAPGAAGPASPLQHLTVPPGSIDNNTLFPPGFTDDTGANIGGQPWVFSTNFTLTYDFQTILFIISQLAVYAVMDFHINHDMQFFFQKFIGNKNTGITLEYGRSGQIEYYNAPLDGDSVVNNILGLAPDATAGDIIKQWVTDTDSVNLYGNLQGVAAFNDVKNSSVLQQRLRQELVLTKDPSSSLMVQLNEKAPEIGTWGIGDIVTIMIDDHIVQVNQQRRIVSYNVRVHPTGKEAIQIITNLPRDNQ